MAIIIWVLLIGIALYVAWQYNRLVVLKNRVKNAWANIDTLLQRRSDLIPNLVNTVKGYASHEKDLLVKLTQARSAVMNSKTIKEKAKASNMLSNTLKSLFAVAENYPNLKANENFMQLQEQLVTTEDKIAYARQYYNEAVMQYNNAIQVFPTNILASMFNFKQKDSFEVTDEKVREAPKVDFS